jgi:hypothetical protein
MWNSLDIWEENSKSKLHLSKNKDTVKSEHLVQ